MPVSYIPSAEQMAERQKTTARKRRRNQNTEIEELSALLPFPTEATGKPGIDKISVLRLATTYIRFQSFLDSVYGEKAASRNMGHTELLAKAMDGFLLVLDEEGRVLYTSETITDYVGLSQQDVIGQLLYDLTQPEDDKIIAENLEPKGTQLSQFRQFYVRFKSTVSPGRMQLSRFTSHIMVQVSGNLKLHSPALGPSGATTLPMVIGLVAECRLIESSSSILELSIPQSSFTSTTSMDCTILSVDTRVKNVLGFDAADFVGTRFKDYFHPADHARMTPCHLLLKRTGHAVSPIFRFMTHTGEWVWVQLDGLVRFKEGTNEPQYIEVKCKVVSAFRGKARMIEQRELYAASLGPVDPAVAADPHRDAYFIDQLPNTACQPSAESFVQALKGVNMSTAAIDTVLHSRELGLQEFPKRLKMLEPPPEMEEAWQRMLSSAATDTVSSNPSPPASVVSSLSSGSSSPPSVTHNSPPFMAQPSPPDPLQFTPSTDSSPPVPEYSAIHAPLSHASVGSESSVFEYPGRPDVNPSSVSDSKQPESSVQSPPSGVPSPDSGILSARSSSSTTGVLSPPSSYGSNSPPGSTVGVLSPETPFSTHELDSHMDTTTPELSQRLVQAAGNGAYNAEHLMQTSVPGSWLSQNPAAPQQDVWLTQNPPPLPVRPLTTSPDDGISESELERLLCEVVALNDYSNTTLAVTPTIPSYDLSNFDATIWPQSGSFPLTNSMPNPLTYNHSTSSNQTKAQSTGGTLGNNHPSLLDIDPNTLTYNGLFMVDPAQTPQESPISASSGLTQADIESNSEVREILQQFM